MKNSILTLVILLSGLLRVSQGQEAFVLEYEVKGGIAKNGSEIFKDSLARTGFLNDLVEQLRAEGYLMADVIRFEQKEDTVSKVFLETGERYYWVQLNKGNLGQRMLVKSGFDSRRFDRRPFNHHEAIKLFDRVLSQAEDEGYPFAAIRLDSIRQSGDSLEASIHFERGPFIAFDTLQVTGNSKSDPVFLGRLLRVQPGEPFSQRKVNQSIRRLQNFPYLKLESKPELSFQNSEATLYLPLNDRKINAIDGIIGFLPNETEESKMLITGQFDLALYNVGGKGRNYNLHWQRLTQYTQNLTISAVEPMVLGSGIDVRASFSMLKEDTTFINRDFRLDFGYQVSPKTFMTFFSQWQSGDLLSVSHLKNAEVLPDVLDYRFHNYGISIDINGLDDVFFPRNGWRSSMETGVGNKRILPNTGVPDELYEEVDSETLQFYVKGSFEYYAMLWSRLGLMASLNVGELSNKRLLRNDLYRLGGLRSIRGFNENFFFTNRYVYTNFEPRYYFGGDSYFLVFLDIGRLGNSLMEKSEGIDYPLSFGAGISLETQSGVFNFIYGVGKSNHQEMGVNFSKIHFGYTGRF